MTERTIQEVNGNIKAVYRDNIPIYELEGTVESIKNRLDQCPDDAVISVYVYSDEDIDIQVTWYNEATHHEINQFKKTKEEALKKASDNKMSYLSQQIKNLSPSDKAKLRSYL